MQSTEVVHNPVTPSRFASMWRTLLVFSSVLTCCVPAMAGHYEPLPSPNPTGGAISPSGSFYPYQGDSYSGQGGDSTGAGGTATAQITDGKLVKKYQWVKDDPLDPYDTYPKKVVVTMSCTVTTTSTTSGGPRTSSSTSLPTPSANASNGLGDPGTPTYGSGVNSSGVPYSWAQASSSGTHTIIIDGKDELDVECTISGSGSATAISDYGSTAGVAINVGWTVIHVRPIQISLSKSYVIGQKAVATVTNGGLTPVSYSWTVSGGEPFASYVGSSSSGVYTPLGALTNSSAQFYWKKPAAPATVSCSVQLTLPDNSVTTVNAEKKCDVEKPEFALDADLGSVAGVPDPGPPTMVVLIGAKDRNGNPVVGTLNNNTQVDVGIIWFGTVRTPDAFNSSGTTWGEWQFTQIVTPDRRYSYSTTSPVMIPSSLNGTPVLDGHFAYGTHTHPANGTEYLDGDAPFQGFSSYTAISINDQFHTYLMYLPPGTATHVPLKDLTWSWQASANRLSGTWQIPSKSAQWAAGSEFPAHPVWTNNVNNNTYP